MKYITNKLPLRSASLLACLGLYSQAQAATTVYTSRSAWEAAAAGLGLNVLTEDFNSFTALTDSFQNSSNLQLPSVGLQLTHANPSTADDNIVQSGTESGNIDGTNFLRIDDNPGNLLIGVNSGSIYSGEISAFAFDYHGYGGGAEGLSAIVNGVSTSIQSVLPEHLAGTSPTLFFGFIDDNSSNFYTSLSTTGTDGFFGLDNLSIGTTVPEPSSCLLLGFGGLVMLNRRKR